MDGKLIYEKITEVMRAVGGIGKDRQNQSQGYKFRGIDDVYNALHAPMGAAGIFTSAKISNKEEYPVTSGKGTGGYRVVLTVLFQMFASDGSSVETMAIGEGIDYGDKAYNKAMSVAHKYALIQLFCIPTEEQKDPEVDSHEIKPETPKDATKNNISIDEIGKNLTDPIKARIRAAKIPTSAVVRLWTEGGETVAGFTVGLKKIEDAYERSSKGEVAP
jgi:hypothetical protein